MHDKKIAYLTMIQAVITRMSTCSFMVRGWAITIVAAIFALANQNADQRFFVIAYLPIVAFWVLDGFYLSQERAYRRLYDKVRPIGEDDVDFSMESGWSTADWTSALLSLTLLIFWGILAAGTLLLMYSVPFPTPLGE